MTVFQSGNEKIMILEDGSVLQAIFMDVKDKKGKVIGQKVLQNKNFSASGDEYEWDLDGDMAKSSAILNYNKKGNFTHVAVANERFIKFNFMTSNAANGMVFNDWALPADRHGDAKLRQERDSKGRITYYDKSYKGTTDGVWRAMTQAADRLGIHQMDVYALNYGLQTDANGKASGNFIHSTGAAMDLNYIRYMQADANGKPQEVKAYIHRDHNFDASQITRIQSFNQAVWDASGGTARIYTPFGLRGTPFGSDQWTDYALKGSDGVARFNSMNALIKEKREALKPLLKRNEISQREFNQIVGSYTQQLQLMRGHPNHGHYAVP